MNSDKKPKSANKSKDRPALRPRSSRQSNHLFARASFGRTEKILRRNAPLWRRLFSKEGRRLDQDAIEESVGSA